MPTRRAAGEGSIYHDEKRGRWVGSIDIGIVGGKRRRVQVTGKTRAIVAKKMNAERVRIAEAPPVAEAPPAAEVAPYDGSRPGPRATTGAWLLWWVREVMPRTVGADSENTRHNYTNTIESSIVPALGHIRLRDLRSHHVDRMLADMLSLPSPHTGRVRKPATVRAIRNNLAKALDRMARLGAPLVGNPAREADPPGASTGPRVDDTLAEDQVDAVVATARGDRWEPVALLGLDIGLRGAEVAGLRWSDIDMAAVDDDGEPRPTLRVGKAKTAAGVRVVPLTKRTVDALRRHAENQEAEIAAAPAWEDDTGLLFTTTVGEPQDRNRVLKWWYKACDRAGIPRSRFHDTRHTAATRWLNIGVPLIVVSKLLGHASIAITADTYAKVRPELLHDAVEAMDALDAARSAARAG